MNNMVVVKRIRLSDRGPRGRSYLLLALGAVPGGPRGGFEGGLQAVGVVGAGAVVTGLEITLLLADGAVLVVLQVLLRKQQQNNNKQNGNPLSWSFLSFYIFLVSFFVSFFHSFVLSSFLFKFSFILYFFLSFFLSFSFFHSFSLFFSFFRSFFL